MMFYNNLMFLHKSFCEKICSIEIKKNLLWNRNLPYFVFKMYLVHCSSLIYRIFWLVWCWSCQWCWCSVHGVSSGFVVIFQSRCLEMKLVQTCVICLCWCSCSVELLCKIRCCLVAVGHVLSAAFCRCVVSFLATCTHVKVMRDEYYLIIDW